jgi:hypothetical protein
LEERSNVHIKLLGEADKRCDRQVRAPTLDLSDPVRSHVAPICELLLGEIDPPTQLCDPKCNVPLAVSRRPIGANVGDHGEMK